MRPHAPAAGGRAGRPTCPLPRRRPRATAGHRPPSPSGRVTAATIPSSPNTARPISPTLRLRTDAIPSDGGHDREHHADADQQHRLVAGPEGADREALEPFGGEIDRGGPHRDHRRGLPADEAGHQVGDGDRDAGREQPHDGTEEPVALGRAFGRRRRGCRRVGERGSQSLFGHRTPAGWPAPGLRRVPPATGGCRRSRRRAPCGRCGTDRGRTARSRDRRDRSPASRPWSCRRSARP